MVELKDRVKLYNQAFPEYPNLIFDKGWILGTWAIGNTYRREKGYHGEFPPSFLNRILAMFPDKKTRLFVFSGTLDRYDGITVDINPALNPNIVSSVEDMPLEASHFDLAIADPPYSDIDAKKYGYPLPSKPKCMRELARVVKPGGYLIWLDLMVPKYRNEDWKLVGIIGLYCGTNRRFRSIAIFERPGEIKGKPLW